MDCLIKKLNEKDQFISKIKQDDKQVTQFFHYNAMHSTDYLNKLKSENNGREQKLANIINDYMNDLDLTELQKDHIQSLSKGAKVVIGGQQAGLFGGPLYTFHKIFSIITLSQQLSKEYDFNVVPVFWIAGEDHDFEEVNHFNVYNRQKAELKKVKYHTLEPPENGVSNYKPDKDELLNSLNRFFKELKETKHTKPLIEICTNIIERYDYWSDMFKALIHEVFKDYGLLLIDANNKKLRSFERPFFKTIIENHQQIDSTFRKTQQDTMANNIEQMIQTDSNVHLFLEKDEKRQLLTFENDYYYLSKSDEKYTKEQLFKILDEEPHRFSNNVVTRPLMEEWLFNTVAFVGGPSEIKYWTELNDIFTLLNIPLPIVMPRLRISYLNERIEKLISQYELNTAQIIENGIVEDKDKFIRARASTDFIERVSALKEEQANLYQSLESKVENNNDNKNLLAKNNEIHQQQFDYLLKRYMLNIERENDVSMKHFREIKHVLHPMGGLQERIWNPLQILNEFGLDVFSPSTYPPLSYTFDHIIIKP